MPWRSSASTPTNRNKRPDSGYIGARNNNNTYSYSDDGSASSSSSSYSTSGGSSSREFPTRTFGSQRFSGAAGTGATSWLTEAIRSRGVRPECLPPHILYYMSYNDSYLRSYYDLMEKYLSSQTCVPEQCLQQLMGTPQQQKRKGRR